MKKTVKSTLAALLAAVTVLSFVPSAWADGSPFSDVKTDFWAYDAIVETYNDGVMTGTDTAARTFSPDRTLDMAEFTTILARAFYKDELRPAAADENWWDPAYEIAYPSHHGLFGEVHNIAANTQTTREAMAEMMYRVLVDKGSALPSDTELQAAMGKIPDLSAVDSNFRTAVAVCYSLELLSGVDNAGTFAPKDVLDRAQTAVIYTRLKKAVNAPGGTTAPSTPATPDTPATPPETTTPSTTTDPGETTQPATGAVLTNGMPVTEENVLALIEEYKNGKEPGQKAKEAGFTSYVDRSTYDAYDPVYNIRQLGSGTACAKFAFAFSDDIFGYDTPIREFTNPADVRPGDLIHYSGHWCIATKKAEWLETYNCYVASDVAGGTTGDIDWGNTDNNINRAMAFYTRYPE